MNIKVKEITEGCMPEIIKKGEWIDLKSAIDFTIDASVKKREVSLIPLGVAMEIPKGFEAILAPRSSSPSKFKFTQANSFGVIDNSYKGDEDEWKLPIIPVTLGKDSVKIAKGDRICQFRIQLSQKATIWQKIKWFFSNKITLVKVDSLGNSNRGGFGTTGK